VSKDKARKNACDDLWAQSTILETVLDNCPPLGRGLGHYKWYQSWPMTVSYKSGRESHEQPPSGAKILGWTDGQENA